MAQNSPILEKLRAKSKSLAPIISSGRIRFASENYNFLPSKSNVILYNICYREVRHYAVQNTTQFIIIQQGLNTCASSCTLKKVGTAGNCEDIFFILLIFFKFYDLSYTNRQQLTKTVKLNSV